MRVSIALLATVSVALSACSGGGGDEGSYGPGGLYIPPGICRPIADVGATIGTTATGASVNDALLAFDGDLGTVAEVEALAPAGPVSIRGTLGTGLEPGGEAAGILFSNSLLNANNNMQVTITTYLDGVPQETGPAVHTVSGEMTFFGINTLLDFDSIEASFPVGESGMQFHELCVR